MLPTLGEDGASYEQVAYIGHGAQGSVMLVQATSPTKIASHRQQYVVKRLPLHEPGDQHRALQEAKALKLLSSHPNIVDFHEVFYDYGSDEGANTGNTHSLNIVMSYCDAGDLSAAIRARSRSGIWFSEREILDWFTQITQAVSFMHQRGWIHRDLKPSNILLTSSGVIKLGDLGLAQYIGDEDISPPAPATATSASSGPLQGTPYYLPPEQCKFEPFSKKSDMWALGCVLYELCALRHAFYASNLLAVVFRIVKQPFPPLPSHYSPELRDLVSRLLNKDPACRPMAHEILSEGVLLSHAKFMVETWSLKTVHESARLPLIPPPAASRAIRARPSPLRLDACKASLAADDGGMDNNGDDWVEGTPGTAIEGYEEDEGLELSGFTACDGEQRLSPVPPASAQINAITPAAGAIGRRRQRCCRLSGSFFGHKTCGGDQDDHDDDIPTPSSPWQSPAWPCESPLPAAATFSTKVSSDFGYRSQPQSSTEVDYVLDLLKEVLHVSPQPVMARDDSLRL